MKKHLFPRLFSGLGLALAAISPIMAQAATTESSTSSGAFLSTAGEAAILIGLLVVILLLSDVIKKFGPSVLGYILRYFRLGVISLLLTRVFVLLVDLQMITIGDGALEFWWHIIFYFSMFMFFMGAKSLVEFSSTGNSKANTGTLRNATTMTIVFMMVIFIISVSSSAGFEKIYVGSTLDGFGFHHIIAVLSAGLVSFYLFSVRSKIGLISKGLSTPLISALAVLSLQHLWELFSESWELIAVEDAVIEKVEQVFVSLSIIFFILAVLNIRRIAKMQSAPAVQPPAATPV